MSKQDTQVFLEQLGSIPAKIESLKVQQDRIIDNLYPHWESNGVYKNAIKDWLSELSGEISDLEKQREHILSVIDQVTDESLRQLLRFRYVERLEWVPIILRMHYAEGYQYVLHNKALRAVEEILEAS